MMRRFMVLLKKELRELLTPQILLPFVLVIAVFGVLGQTLSAVGADQAELAPLAVADEDGGPYAQVVFDALEQAGFETVAVEGELTDDTAKALLDSADANIVVGIPAGFSEALAAGEPQPLPSWTRVRNFSVMGNADISSFGAAMASVNSAIAVVVATQAAPGVPAAVLQQPVVPAEHVIVGDNSAETPAMAVMSFVSQQTTFIPLVLFMVIMFAAQMIAVAIATEKENKTLETLLSYPVSRGAIVTSKMVAAGLVALLSAGAYMLGMQQYMDGMEASFSEGLGGGVAEASAAAMGQLGLTYGPSDYLMLGLTLFASILVALSMAIILGAFAESVKSVGSLIAPLMVLMMLPYLLTMIVDVSVMPDALRYAILAIPFTYSFITGPALFLGDYGLVWWGIAYQLVWFVAFAALAARVFSSDRILTMKLSLRKKRSAPAA